MPPAPAKYYADARDRYYYYHFANQLYIDPRGFCTQANELFNRFSDPNFRREHPAFTHLSPEECAAIYLHTAEDYSLAPPGRGSEMILYRYVNNIMRKNHAHRGGNHEINSAMQRVAPHINVLVSALNKIIDAAPFSGTVYRGIHGDAGQVEHLYRLYHSRSEYIEPAFMSTTRDKDCAQVFEANTFNNIAFEIRVREGADIKAATQATSEEEILLTPGSRFRIDFAQSFGSGKHLFKLVQI